MKRHYISGEPGKSGLSVAVYNDNIEKAIKSLKKMVMAEGLLKEIKDRQAYEKPSVIGRRRKKEAVRRQRKMDMLRKKNETQLQ